MSLITDYIKANRPTCIGVWDFGAGVGNPMNVPELINQIPSEAFVGSSGAWTTGGSGSGFAGQDKFASIGSSSTNKAQIAAGTPGGAVFTRNLTTVTYEIMVKLTSTSGVQDLIGPDGNTNGGLCIRLNPPHFEAVENYIAVPVIGTATPDTNWHILAATINLETNYVWRLYIDGVQDGTSAINNAPTPAADTGFDVANCNHANNTSVSSWGYVAVYNTALTVAQLAANFNVAKNGPTVDPNLGVVQPIVRGLVG